MLHVLRSMELLMLHGVGTPEVSRPRRGLGAPKVRVSEWQVAALAQGCPGTDHDSQSSIHGLRT